MIARIKQWIGIEEPLTQEENDDRRATIDMMRSSILNQMSSKKMDFLVEGKVNVSRKSRKSSTGMDFLLES